MTENCLWNFDMSQGHNFTFATIAGAGHMAPTFKPPQALAMLRRFLANQPL
jgi:carboxypeptidase C (cathepsin A)